METLLRQKIRDLLRENSEMKQLIIFLDDERNYAKLIFKQINEMQTKNWNLMKSKLEILEQKQFDLICENYCLKQLCILMDNKRMSQQKKSGSDERKVAVNVSAATESVSQTYLASHFLEYVLTLESELKDRNIPFERPNHVSKLLRIREAMNSLDKVVEKDDETAIVDSLV